jgi:hypothetical protein
MAGVLRGVGVMKKITLKVAATLAYAGLVAICLTSHSFEAACAFLAVGICGPLALYGIWEDT